MSPLLGRTTRRRAAKRAPAPFDLSRPLVWFSREDPWTVGDACQGTQVFGATGSGKTSGSGRAIARSMLASGFGGLVLTSKPGERAEWERYCRETGRSESLLVVSADGAERFNFLSYEHKRPGAGAGRTENLVALFLSALEVIDRGSSGGGREDGYWRNALKQLLRNAIDLVAIGQGEVTLRDLHRVIESAPLSEEQSLSEGWRRGALCARLLDAGEAAEKTPQRARDFEMTARYWLSEYPYLPDRTRGSITSMFTSMADGLMRGSLGELFCTTTTFVPEVCFEGAVVLLDLPVKEYGELGRAAQVLFKHVWQQAVERRATGPGSRPVFLWADEAQLFIVSGDARFQTTARSAKVATVLLTQSISNYYAELGSREGRDLTHSLLGNLNTKIFHAAGDPEMNRWAEDLFAKKWTPHASASAGERQDRRDPLSRPSVSSTTSESLDPEVLAGAFTRLRTGGEANGCLVDAIVFQGGRTWKLTGRNHMRVVFDQRA